MVGSFPLVFGLVSFSPGPILESVFLWRCFCRKKPPCRTLEHLRAAMKHTCPVEWLIGLAQREVALVPGSLADGAECVRHTNTHPGIPGLVFARTGPPPRPRHPPPVLGSSGRGEALLLFYVTRRFYGPGTFIVHTQLECLVHFKLRSLDFETL